MFLFQFRPLPGTAKKEKKKYKMANENRMVDPMDVTWSERYNKTFEKVWAKLPNFIGSFIATAAVFILGSSIHGKIIFFIKRKLN
jgi:VanZ family protein